MKLGEVLRARIRGEAQSGIGPVPGAAAEPGQGPEETVQWIPIDAIDPSPYQARVDFEGAAGEELAASIEQHGVLQPIVVRPRGERFELVVGERRWRACRRLGWERIPAVVRTLSDREAAEMVMIENLQRRNLNPMEVALGYERLLTEFQLTQQALAERLGISQSAVANKLRLLKLPDPVRQLVAAGGLSERHARALLRLPAGEQMVSLADWAVRTEATVRELEARVEEERSQGGRKQRGESGPIPGKGPVERFLKRLGKMVATLEAAGVPVDMEKVEAAGTREIRIRITESPRGTTR